MVPSHLFLSSVGEGALFKDVVAPSIPKLQKHFMLLVGVFPSFFDMDCTADLVTCYVFATASVAL